ncbi:MAG: peptide deformylase [Endozoicomonadaceae bacterium]|nr:peptide deformylase [Endozoicomonadaceae bacterium]
MAILPLVYEPAAVLKKVAEPVVDFNDELQVLINDMFDTMYANNGCGLAAPQIGKSLSLSVIDTKGKGLEKIVIINPVIIETRGEHEMEAGCLSIPGSYAIIKRPAWVKVKAQDATGKFFEIEGEGLLGECLQHEIDHLNGKLFVDYLSSLKRKILTEKSRKIRKRLKRNN